MKNNNGNIKIIHYCWFGPSPLSKLAKKCMKSWQKFLPDYEIKLWNEETFDFNQNIFVKPKISGLPISPSYSFADNV